MCPEDPGGSHVSGRGPYPEDAWAWIARIRRILEDRTFPGSVIPEDRTFPEDAWV